MALPDRGRTGGRGVCFVGGTETQLAVTRSRAVPVGGLSDREKLAFFVFLHSFDKLKLCCFDISTGQRNLGIHSISSAARSAGELFSPAAPLLPFFRFPRPLSHSFVPLRRSLIFIARARDLEIGAGVLWGRAGRAIYEMGKWQWNEGPKCEFGADPCYGHARTGGEARQVARRRT